MSKLHKHSNGLKGVIIIWVFVLIMGMITANYINAVINQEVSISCHE